jgi:hypothetical protein
MKNHAFMIRAAAAAGCALTEPHARELTQRAVPIQKFETGRAALIE